MNYHQLKRAIKKHYKSLPRNKRHRIFEGPGICILSLNHIFKIFHCLECDDCTLKNYTMGGGEYIIVSQEEIVKPQCIWGITRARLAKNSFA